MTTVGIKAAAYCLNFAPELALHYGGTPAQERRSKPDSEFLRELPKHAQTWEQAAAYAPNKTYVGGMSLDELEKAPAPWIDNLGDPQRYGKFGEIMPEDEFIGLMDICDVFDLIWLEQGFAAAVAEKLARNPVMGEKQLARLEKGKPVAELQEAIEKQHALPLYFENTLVACCRRAHDTDENLEAGVMLENLASKASGVLALLHLIKNAGMAPADVDFVVECSEEAVGDAMQRGGGNMANALIGGMVKQGFAASEIDVIDLGADARARLSAAYGVTCHASAETAPAAPDILVLAVKPQQMKEAVVPLVGKLGNALVISIAAGLDMGQAHAARQFGIGGSR